MSHHAAQACEGGRAGPSPSSPWAASSPPLPDRRWLREPTGKPPREHGRPWLRRAGAGDIRMASGPCRVRHRRRAQQPVLRGVARASRNDRAGGMAPRDPAACGMAVMVLPFAASADAGGDTTVTPAATTGRGSTGCRCRSGPPVLRGRGARRRLAVEHRRRGAASSGTESTDRPDLAAVVRVQLGPHRAGSRPHLPRHCPATADRPNSRMR